MSIRVMLVDDSDVVRAIVSKGLAHKSEIEIVANAANGKEAVSLAKLAKPDVIILDIEMPQMDGLTALPLLLSELPDVKIIVLSRLVQTGNKQALEVLEKGAADCISKPDGNQALKPFFESLARKITAVAKRKKIAPLPRPAPAPIRIESPIQTPPAPLRITSNKIAAIGIASSTGGPRVLHKIFDSLGRKALNVPVYITQHMPPVFTGCLAENLKKSSGLKVKEAQNAERPEPGCIYVAPGDHHMTIEVNDGNPTIRISKGPYINSCRPSADPMFESLAAIYGRNLLAIVLTGMGRDGCGGVKAVSLAGGKVISQEEKSCTVYGMPKAVDDAGLTNESMTPDQIASYLKRLT